MKNCPACKDVKPSTEFRKSSRAKSGLQTYCKPCQNEMFKSKPELMAARVRRYRDKKPAEATYRYLIRRAEKNEYVCMSKTAFCHWFYSTIRVCAYCDCTNEEAKQLYKHNLHIDRKDSKLGYIDTNIVFACHRCNVVKNKYLSHEQMMTVAGMFFGGPQGNNYYELMGALEFLIDGCKTLEKDNEVALPNNAIHFAQQALNKAKGLSE